VNPEIIYVLNRDTNVLHKLVDGRGYEGCNLDQAKHQGRITAAAQGAGARLARLYAKGVSLCERCWPDGMWPQ